MDVDQAAHTLLATIRDHFGFVNCVRWTKHGHHIASGSDDNVILIHEKKPRTGTTEFGSCDDFARAYCRCGNFMLTYFDCLKYFKTFQYGFRMQIC